jgi:hypothetical protein
MADNSISQSVGKVTLGHATEAVRLAEKWKDAAEDWERSVKEHGPDSAHAREATHKVRRAADKVSDSLCPLIHLESRSGHVDQDDWDDLKAENSVIADALVKLRLAALDGQRVVHPARAKDTKHAPRDWVDRLEEATENVEAIIKGGTERIFVDLARHVVVIDGKEHPVSHNVALTSYERVAKANGDNVPGRTLDRGRIDRKLRDHLPPEVQETYHATSGNGGGYALKPEFCRKGEK